ncbi:hypothetical protein [Nocardioides sp. Leaf307]|uniref:hypothetical protein n=1 Tax=Nocardioides sp. Leaf307 TaxID=1736331 RepID=UPI000703848B|nr:hypothetical protein [Nocardioides sp. Leaf307]KQQ39535.1 hypothetical protein ASF50_16635 [Nocardioides sp. Leaf307]
MQEGLGFIDHNDWICARNDRQQKTYHAAHSIPLLVQRSKAPKRVAIGGRNRIDRRRFDSGSSYPEDKLSAQWIHHETLLERIFRDARQFQKESWLVFEALKRVGRWVGKVSAPCRGL